MKGTTNDTEIVLCVEINWRRRYFPPDSILTKISNPFVSHKMDKNGDFLFSSLFCRQITKGLRNLLQKKVTFPTLLRNQTFFSMYVHPIFMVPLWCANGAEAPWPMHDECNTLWCTAHQHIKYRYLLAKILEYFGIYHTTKLTNYLYRQAWQIFATV